MAGDVSPPPSRGIRFPEIWKGNNSSDQEDVFDYRACPTYCRWVLPGYRRFNIKFALMNIIKLTNAPIRLCSGSARPQSPFTIASADPYDLSPSFCSGNLLFVERSEQGGQTLEELAKGPTRRSSTSPQIKKTARGRMFPSMSSMSVSPFLQWYSRIFSRVTLCLLCC